MVIQNATLVCFADSGECAAQGISEASDLDVSRTEPAEVGPVLASEFSFHDCSYCLRHIGGSVICIYVFVGCVNPIDVV